MSTRFWYKLFMRDSCSKTTSQRDSCSKTMSQIFWKISIFTMSIATLKCVFYFISWYPEASKYIFVMWRLIVCCLFDCRRRLKWWGEQIDLRIHQRNWGVTAEVDRITDDGRSTATVVKQSSVKILIQSHDKISR